MNNTLFLFVQLISHWMSHVPGAVLISFALCFLLLLAGWVGSTVAGFLSKNARWLRVFLAFPLTNPIALLFFLVKDWKAARPALMCYLAAFVVLWAGGLFAETLEKRRLSDETARLASAGESLAMASIIPKPVPAESNIWAHPFLEAMAEAGQSTPEGREARDSNPYESLEVPAKASTLNYPSKSADGSPIPPAFAPFQELHEIALTVIAKRDGALNERNTPKSWSDCGTAVIAHFQSAEADFSRLREALDRPEDQYPYAWNDANSRLLPPLAKLKSFTRSAAVRTVAYATMAKPDEAYRELRLCLRLVHTGDSDLLLSRLVQTQSSITLKAIQAAQQFPNWNDAQWREIDAQLRTLDFPSLVPASLRAERVSVNATFQPMLNLSPSGIVQQMDRLGRGRGPTVPGAGPAQFFWRPINILLGGHFRATLTRQWVGCLTAYQEMIEGFEQTLVRTRTQPWKDCRPPPLSKGSLYKGSNGYGILARYLLSYRENDYDKALAAQARIQLAQVACALERYYLANQSYPETLQALARYEVPMRDPMDHQPWRYARIGQTGFRLYTVGANGVDDGGESNPTTHRSEPRKDDELWIVHPTAPPLPAFEYAKPDPSGTVMSREMMKRYGLLPRGQPPD